MNQLTVTIITLNEELDLPRALDSVADVADEVLVVDSGSTDRTCEIAREKGAHVLHRDWTNYSDQKNFAATEAAHDWILSLDADEELSPTLRQSLLHWKKNTPKLRAYAIRRRAHYLGEWIHHCGWYPDTKVRLYHRQHARFVGALHESIRCKGPVEELEGDLYHYTVRTFAEHTKRVSRYTTIAAQELFSAGRRHWLLPMLLVPPWTFLRTYLLQQGFRDGYRGWLISRMAAYYTFLKYRKLGVLVRGGSLAPEPKRGNA